MPNIESRILTGRRYSHVIYIGFVLLMCCLVLLLSACDDPLAATTTASTPTATPFPNETPVGTITTRDSLQTEAETRSHLARVQQMMSQMTLEQKLGQLIIVEYLGNDYQGTGLQNMIANQFVGGFLYQYSNHNFDAPYDTISKLQALSAQTESDAKIPLLIGTDQEGGLVNRLYTYHGPLPSAETMASSGDPNVALTQGTQAAKWMLELGINADLAPVVDVQTVDPPILITRMFGRDPQTVAKYAGAYLNGLQNNGVMGCLKHFPGLGAVDKDPHGSLPVINRSMADLESIDFAPYKLMIKQNHPAMIMATNVIMPAIDSKLPAELSPKAIDGILRGELGYNGVVITDGLYMIKDFYSLAEASILSIIAGNDLIEGPFTVSQVANVVTGFKNAIQQGRLTLDRIDQSVQRILLMKMQYGLIK